MKRTALTVLALTLFASSAFAAHPTTTHFQVTPLISDHTGGGPVVDPNLINPWGLSQAPGGPLWVSDQGTGLSTLYDRRTGAIQPLVVTIPKAGPTGQVYVPGGGFAVSEGDLTGDSVFLFDSVTGVISGWAPSVDAANAIVAVDNSANGAVYTGLAIGNNKIYAANVVGNAVEIYDKTFKPVGTFTDPDLPKHFGPFNVAVIKNKVYVAFTHLEKRADPHNKLHIDKKAGKGYVDVFTLDGTLTQRLISNGKLNAPWGMIVAPTSFGSFAGSLLVGNFGNGKINAYDIKTGAFIGTLSDSSGKAIKLDGLWALDGGPDDKITFSSGPAGETQGLVGFISVAD